jgi:Bacteriophage Mu, GemA protein
MAPTRAKLAKIHIAKKELQLTDEIYRDILFVNFGVESAAKLSDAKATEMIEILKKKGWKPKPASKARGPRRDGNYIEIKPGPTAAQQRKVLAMWNELGYAMDKLHSRCKRQFNVERIEWLTDPKALHVLITDLDKRIQSMKDGK